jgi:hypothetical protein
MIQSKLPSRINKDVLPSNKKKKKDAYKSSSDLYRKYRHFVQVLKKKKRKKEKGKKNKHTHIPISFVKN